MYERLLDKQRAPEFSDMAEYCGRMGELFISLNAWLAQTFQTVQKITFPYGNGYGWGVAHRVKQKLVCNIFAENNAFTVMVRLSDKQFASVYETLREKTRREIDNRHPCGDGGWIHSRIACTEDYEDIQKILTIKNSS